MMQAPHTYAEWSQVLEHFEAGLDDDAVLTAMGQASLSWSGGVAALFAQRINDSFNLRLGRCSERLTRALHHARDEASVVRAVLDARRSLALLLRVAQMPAFPEVLQQHLGSELRKFAQRAQEALDDSARQDRSGRLAFALRHNPLTRFDAYSPPPQQPHTAGSVDATQVVGTPTPDGAPAAGTRRRTILF
jgi:hypothetical protein